MTSLACHANVDGMSTNKRLAKLRLAMRHVRRFDNRDLIWLLQESVDELKQRGFSAQQAQQMQSNLAALAAQQAAQHLPQGTGLGSIFGGAFGGLR